MPESLVLNLVAWDNGAGLSRDIDIIESALRDSGWSVHYNGRRLRTRPESFLGRLLAKLRKNLRRYAVQLGITHPPYAVNIFLEDISPEFIELGRKNVLIPNPECFRSSSEYALKRMDVVLTKTRDAEKIFAARGCTTKFIGFTSTDKRSDGSMGTKSLCALHVAGKSLLKGTDAIIDVWSNHPDWPLLNVVRTPVDYDGNPLPWKTRKWPANIRLIDRRISDAELTELQNSHTIYVATSESEGFGHAIVEGLSVGAIVVTSDAPPMNELVRPGFGFLVRTFPPIPIGAGWRYPLDPHGFESQIEKLLELTDSERSTMGKLSRERYDEISREFKPRLHAELSSLIGLP